MNKKLIALLLALAMVFSFAACGKKSTPVSPTPLPSKQETPAQPSNPETKPEQKPETKPEVKPNPVPEQKPEEKPEQKPAIDENGSYDSKDEVALYIATYGKLPKNYMTKNEAKALGWEGGSLEKFAKGMCIGGDNFGNYEGVLPKVKGRKYTECDIDTLGAKARGAKRIIFSNDGYIYYTEDHYEHFETLYEAGVKVVK